LAVNSNYSRLKLLPQIFFFHKCQEKDCGSGFSRDSLLGQIVAEMALDTVPWRASRFP